MHRDERDLLEVLKFELEFLEAGGYGRSPKTPWRPLYIFEDSLTCMNYHSKENREPCSECVLMQLVPSEFRLAEIPCRHIPFNASGENLDTLYGYGDQREIEDALGKWLRTTIHRVEAERTAASRDGNNPPALPDEAIKGTPLYQEQHPKCANPACSTAFHWSEGGKFFRFRPDAVSQNESNSTTDAATGMHGVKHYWLCGRCSVTSTLVYDAESGVVLKLRWPELPATEPTKELTV
jgi:hypothetical protein